MVAAKFWAASVEALQPATTVGRLARIFSTGNGTPMIPVED
jgi:hypothetical protein